MYAWRHCIDLPELLISLLIWRVMFGNGSKTSGLMEGDNKIAMAPYASARSLILLFLLFFFLLFLLSFVRYFLLLPNPLVVGRVLPRDLLTFSVGWPPKLLNVVGDARSWCYRTFPPRLLQFLSPPCPPYIPPPKLMCVCIYKYHLHASSSQRVNGRWEAVQRLSRSLTAAWKQGWSVSSDFFLPACLSSLSETLQDWLAGLIFLHLCWHEEAFTSKSYKAPAFPQKGGQVAEITGKRDRSWNYRKAWQVGRHCAEIGEHFFL